MNHAKVHWLRRHFPLMPLSEALRYTRALASGDAIGLEFELEDEIEPWDCDHSTPRYVLCGLVRLNGRVIASLGMIGVNDLSDPYLDIIRAELFAEALEVHGAEHVSEFVDRATYAGVQL